MKTWLIGALVAALVATTVSTPVEAKRLGGSKSSGMQRNMPERTNPSTPAQPAQPTQPGATPGQNAAAPAAVPGAAAAPAAAAAKRSWMGPIAGLAAGLGLAALASYLGFGAELANFLMMALLGIGLVFLVMFLLRRFGGGKQAALRREPALAGAAAGNGTTGWTQPQLPVQRTALDAPLPPAGAAPAGDSAASAAPAALVPAAAARSVPAAFVPAAFDSEGFARTAKMIFIRLQAANDTADLDDLRRFTTPELFASLRLDLQERGAAQQHTDVRQVDATVLDVTNETEQQVVSVRFTGEMVEEAGAAPTRFDEVWHLVKPHDDSKAWAIAGIEQMS
jgi:predicted lipid-binding transport protein (Tim44 family)